MFVSIMETARNSTFRNPFVTTVNCDADTTSNGTKTLVANRNIAAAAATAEGGKDDRSSAADEIRLTDSV